MALRPHYVGETQTLRRVANNPKCRFRFTAHALEEMKKDGWTVPDVQFALMNGQVVLQENKKDILWRVQGTDVDGSALTAIVAVFDLAIEIKVVTVF